MSELLTLENFEGYLDKLKSHIKEHQDDGQKVYLVALSRKMPRVINWALNHLSHYKRDEFREAIIKCTYTTELAIPIVFSRPLPDNAYILILDDIIIKGDTVRNAVNDIFFMTGIQADVWCFYAYKEARAPRHVGQIILAYPLGLEYDTAIKNLGAISNVIFERELPTDIEYPILHLKKGFQDIDDKEFNNTFIKEWLNFTSKKINYCTQNTLQKTISEQHIVSHNAIFCDENDRCYCNDFSKIRLFYTKDEYKIVSFSPNILSQTSLNDPKLFSNDKYSEIWNEILTTISLWKSNSCPEIIQSLSNAEITYLASGFEYRRERLKMIVACYLFSLSSAIRQLSLLIEFSPNISEISNRLLLDVLDIQLILGPDVDPHVFSLFQIIIKDRITSDLPRTLVDLPETIVDEHLFEKYILSRQRIVNGVKDNNDFYQCLNSIFTLGYSLGIEKTLSSFSPLNYENSTQESISALLDVLIVQYKTINSESTTAQSDVKKLINEWLDYNIDLGLVIPRYQRVKDRNQVCYWRRFFHASHLASKRSFSVD